MEPFIAQIIMFGGNFAPRGWALCDGQLLPIAQNQALFSILGTTYGGDGRTTFGLPDLRGRVAMHAGTGPGLSQKRLGLKSGSETNVLTVQQMPQHNHPLTGTVNVEVADQNGDAFAANGNALAARARDVDTSAAIEIYADNATFGNGNALSGVTNGDLAVGQTGDGKAVNNLPPYQTVNYIIALQGIFPSRN